MQKRMPKNFTVSDLDALWDNAGVQSILEAVALRLCTSMQTRV